jgi:predicted phosphodiesterase
MEIEIIGSIDDQSHFESEYIAELLTDDQIALNYGSQFMGRPGTKLYSGDDAIVKLRSELQMNYDRSRKWALHTLTLEKKLSVHHPNKTWFIIRHKADECIVGNICPRLIPLHMKIADSLDYSKEQKLADAVKVYQQYFQQVAPFGKRLDEGLSNFGIDADNKLYYLDDDIYSWDDFVSFSHLLGVLVRNNAWLDSDCAEKLGDALQQLISEFAKDSHTSTMVAGKLRDIFIPDSQRREIMEIIIHKLQSHKTVSKKLNLNNRYLAIFADVHANLPALDAVLSFLRRENITQGIVLGDTVGYGPHPVECIERLQASGFTVLKGNHDHATATGETARGMSSDARWCIEWTIPKLSKSHLQWLNELPLELHGMTSAAKNWLAIHGSPSDSSYFYGYVYEMTYEQNLDNLEQRKIDLCFHGHSHVQGIYIRQKIAVQDKFHADKQQFLEKHRHSLICPGSVGQPRDRDGKRGAKFAIYDQENQEIKFFTIDYPLDGIVNDMRANGFPESLLVRLEKAY